MHPSMMNEHHQYPIQGPRRQGLEGSKSKKHIENNNEGPYLPSNPARRRDRSCHLSSRSFPKQNRLDSCCSRSPSLSATRNTPASVSLDDVVATPRQSRWESQSSSSLDKASATPMSMPTRRRGSRNNNDPPTRPNRPTKPQEKQQFPTNTPRNSNSKSLKSIRRKLSGDLLEDPDAPRRSSPVSRQKSPRSVIIAESDEEDDHVYVRRTDSDSSLVFGDRRDDGNKPRDNKSSTSSKTRSKSRTGRRRPVPKASTIAISCTTNDYEDDNTSTTMLLDDSLTSLMRSLDKSEDKGHIFVSARHLLTFASDSDTDGC